MTVCSLRPEDAIVVDPHGTWMENWRSQFASLRIQFLRSTVTSHPDPFDGVARHFARVSAP